MSFSGTPLGQGRRLDRQTFLNKHNTSAHQQTQFITRPSTATSASDRPIPTSYAYGAPTLGTRSPPKPLSTASSRDSSSKTEPSSRHPADDTRVARLKQREQPNPTSTNLANVSSRTILNNPDPTKWAVKGTSVQAANAIHQAAMALNPKDSWASSQRTVVPRSSSVEYEKETQSTTTRRLNAPPPRNGPPPSRSAAAASKLGRQTSVRYAPDSEGEDTSAATQGRQERARTPLDSVIDLAKRTAFYLRQRSTEPDVGRSEQGQNGHHNGNNNNHDESYDYAAEEREYQTQSASVKARKASNAAQHKRGRISADNKAYRPTQSDLEQSDEEVSDGGKRRKRKSKKNMIGPLTTLPVIDQERKRRRKSRTKTDGIGEGEGERDEERGDEEDEEEEEEDSGSDRAVSPQRSIHSSQRLSQPREPQRPPSRASLPRASSIPPPPTFVEDVADVTLDSHERGLDSIAEHNEAATAPSGAIQPQYSRRAFSIGGFLGRIVNLVLRLIADLFIYVLRILSALMNIVGQGLGGAFDALFNKPAHWIRRSNPAFLVKWLIVGAILYSALLGLNRTSLVNYIPSLPSQTTRYHAPEEPAANIAELSERLQALENALASLSLDTEQSRARIDSQARSHTDAFGRLGALESRIQKEGARAAEDRNVDRVAASQGLQAVRHEIDALRSAVAAAQQSERVVNTGPMNDAEARAKLSMLEERVGSFEGGLREALELGKNSAKTGGAVTSAAWWSKITSSGKKALNIKASDGQDVTELIGHLVDTAMARHSKDTIAKADFALHSGGAVIIPSLTSDTHEIRPQGVRQHVIGFLTGNGYALGRPPITALHHETHVGHCWPFNGDQGQLGVTLSRIVRIEEISIDHVARDIAWDMRSAPRKMEVWGLIEGASNFAKVAAWDAARTNAGQEIPPQPRSLPHSARYVRIAQFEYDVDAPNAVQTFPVDEDVRASGLDFGIVVLRVLSNWGQEFTCLYRFRVHGQMVESELMSDDAAAVPEAQNAA